MSAERFVWEPNRGAPIPVVGLADADNLLIYYGNLETRADYPFTDPPTPTATDLRLAELVGVPRVYLCRWDGRLTMEYRRREGKNWYCTEAGSDGEAVVATVHLPYTWKDRDGFTTCVMKERITGLEAERCIADALRIKRIIDGLMAEVAL